MSTIYCLSKKTHIHERGEWRLEERYRGGRRPKMEDIDLEAYRL
jgi:hypothetical protein